MVSAYPKFFLFKFRPSSHSEDFTLIATYSSSEKAAVVEETLKRFLEDMEEHPDDYDTDWDPDDARVFKRGNEVWFNVYTAGYLDDVESAILKGKPEKVECYRDYQELTVRVKVPAGLTPEVAVLIGDKDEAEAIRWLTENCGKPKVVENGGDDELLEWMYCGDGIYDDYENKLYLGGIEFDLNKHRNWEVEWF
ncbi:MAG: hypothetical protein DRJ69_00170 [Thermoprotei archaeon]|nr:MAG: hypothetical protein DRJ69_00170 [Thermoprotei archaeon]